MKHLSTGRGRRPAAALAITSLVVAGLGLAPAPATASPAGDRAVGAGTTWLTGQLTDGLVKGEYLDMDGQPVAYDDYGLSADVAFALDAVGGQDATVTRIADALAPVVTSWYDSFGTIYTGSAAKAAALAQTAGKDAASFGGQDLISVVEDRVGTAAPIVGRVQNEGETEFVPPYGPTDSLNVISQGWAARALTTAGSARAADVTAFLLEQQCTEGFFREAMTADKTATEQGCVSGTDSGSVDTTALSVVNILDTPAASPAAKAAAASAVAWLTTQQAADGSFSAGADEGFNANTTGLAGWALAKGGETAAATRAAGWLRGVQVAELAPCSTAPLAAENGSVAFKPSVLASSRATGITNGTLRDQFRRATSQALPALADVPAGTGALTVSAPVTAVEKSTVTVTVSGLGAGEPGCVSFGSVAKPVVGTGTAVSVTFDLPAGAAAHTFTLTTLAGTQTATTAATLTPVVTPAPTPTAAPTPATPEVGSLKAARTVTAKRNKLALTLTCAATAAEACEGKVVVRTTRKVRTGDQAKARKVLIAKKSYSVEPGTSEKVVLTVRRPARALLADGRVKVKAVQTAPGADSETTKFWLRSK